MEYIRLKDKHLYEVSFALQKRGERMTMRMSGNSRSEVERRFKQGCVPDSFGVHGHHIATRDSKGVWRQPTVRLVPGPKQFEALPVDEWHLYNLSI